MRTQLLTGHKMKYMCANTPTDTPKKKKFTEAVENFEKRYVLGAQAKEHQFLLTACKKKYMGVYTQTKVF